MKTSHAVLPMLLVLGSVFLSVWTPAASADVPRQMNYQGYLRDATGYPVSGHVNFAFRIYPDSVGGTACWGPEEHLGVDVVDGLFELVLGRSIPLDAPCFTGSVMWLETWVSGGPLSPRKRITSSAYAIAADFEHVALLVHNDGIDIPVGGYRDQLFFSTAEIDTDNAWNHSTGRFQPKIPGVYMVTLQAMLLEPVVPGSSIELQIVKNSSAVDEALMAPPQAATTFRVTASVSKLFTMNGSTDYIEFWYELFNSSGQLRGHPAWTFAQAFRVY